MKTKLVPVLALFAILAFAFAADKAKLDPFGGFTGIQGKKTGFFHLEKIDSRNWFITPEGNVFFPIGLSHLYSGESDLAAKNVYGGDAEAWLTNAATIR